MKKNKQSNDFSISCALVCNLIVDIYGYTARITRIWELLKDALALSEFELLDPQNVKPELESYLVDRLIDWNTGKDVDFSLIKEAILISSNGELTGKEKLLLKQDDIEDRLWGIFLAVSNPGRKIELN